MNKTNQFRLINQELWVSINYLIEKKIPKKTIDSGILTSKKGESLRWNAIYLLGQQEPFIKYSTIPLNTMNRYLLPSESELPRKDIPIFDLRENRIKKSDITVFTEFRVAANNYWKRYFPLYVDLPIDDNYKQKLSKTHAVIYSIIELFENNYSLKQLFDCYINIQFEYQLIYKTTSYTSFTVKIKDCKTQGIENILPHSLLGGTSNNLKLTTKWQNFLLYHYAKGYNPTKRIVYNKVNEERLKLGLPKISYSTVCEFLSKPIIKNQSEIKRYGEKHFDSSISPYISRKSNQVGDVWELDGTPFPFLVKLPTGKIATMNLVIVVDVHSNRIIGYSLDYSENANMVKKALFMAFKKTGHIPAQIVHDKGSAFMSKELNRIKEYTNFWDTKWLNHRAGNPKAKGTVEKTFGTLNSSVFKLFDGYLGEGIQSKNDHAHPSKEKMKEYWKKKNVKTLDEIKMLLSKSIVIFNNQNINGKESANEKFKRSISSKTVKNFIKIGEEHLALMFYNSTQKKIEKSTIEFQFKNEKHKYVIPKELRLSLNGTRVNIYFNPNDFNWIYIFEPKSDDKFICKIQEDYDVPLLSKDQTEKDWEHINKRLNENKQLKIEVLNHLDSLEDEVKLNIPFTAIVPELHDKELMNDLELQSILKLNQISLDDTDELDETDSFDINRIVIGPGN